ncbi:methionyl-tRNA formyltransferase [candidate division WWE3 bacterium]|jgi:methionyl-tRNA formyltransferase|nr:methionyl-tRNA formyltransferase [candidate division WWE3 bacterium]
MILEGFLFLAGFTGRSQAYAQALANSNINPEYVVLFGTEKGGLPGQISTPPPDRSLKGLFLPRLSEPVKETCERCKWNITTINANNINDPHIYECLSVVKPKVVIYSGYGAQLVSPQLLKLGIPFLHIHAGWLPEYKGSTTMYYSWLKERFCGVSAIFLEENIDSGPILARKRYSLPPDNVDPDYVYDSAIRADLLVSVLTDYVKDEAFKTLSPQTEEGREYYVIHPVLKHLARLSK